MFKSAAKKAAAAEAAFKEQERRRKLEVGHDCVDYPITFYIASSAKNSGSLVAPRIIAASSVYYGPGHPLNRTEVLYPESEGYMPEDSDTGPRMNIVNRRALLRGLLQALVSVKDIYRVGRASTCLHICVSSKYLDLVWNDWLPNWEENGWPTRDEEENRVENRRQRGNSFSNNLKAPSNGIRGRDRATSRASTRMSMTSKADSALSGMSSVTSDVQTIYDDDSNRLVNEDLLRKIAVFRRNFFSNTHSNNKGAAYLKLTNYRQNPSDKLAKEAVHAAALDLTTQVPRARSMGTLLNNGSVFTSSTDSLQRGSMMSNGRIRQGSITSSMSARSPLKKLASLPPAASLSAHQESSNSLSEKSPSYTNGTKKRVSRLNGGEGGAAQTSAKAAPVPALAPAPAPAIEDTVPPTQPAAPKVAPAAVTAAATAAIAKRPAPRKRNMSKDRISEYNTETEFEDFDDAASTLSEPKETQGTLAKLVALPTAAVATTVAAIMGPAQETSLLEDMSSESKSKEFVASGRGSFAKETNEALAAVKPPGRDDLLSDPKEAPRKRESMTPSNRGSIQTPPPGKTPVVSKRRSSALKTATVAAAPASSKADVRREVSQRSARSGSGGARSAAATSRQELPPVEPRPKPAHRGSSFFSLRKKKKNKEPSEPMPTSPSSATYKPPTDRLIDYRPPQGRNLRTTPATAKTVGANEGKLLHSRSRSSSTYDDDDGPAPPRSSAPPAGASTGGRKAGPFSLFKRRTSVREVF